MQINKMTQVQLFNPVSGIVKYSMKVHLKKKKKKRRKRDSHTQPMNDICLSIYWSFSLDWVFLEIRSSPVLHLSTVAASPRTPLVESLVQFTVQGALRPLPQQIFARNCKVNIGISMPWFTKPCPSADWWRSQDFHSLIHCKVLSHSLSCPSLRVPGTYTVTLVTIC